MGDEVRKKGNDVVFAPAMNMLRTPLNGRTFEYFGEDPFLSARWPAAGPGRAGRGVIANVKHFAVNNQEGVGPAVPGPPVGGAVDGPADVDARLDERTLREIYLPQFEAAVKRGGAGSVMCSYPRVNGQYACENEHLLEEILKGDWGFKGFVLTDYGADKNTINALNNGLDLDIWPGVAYRPPLVNAALAPAGEPGDGRRARPPAAAHAVRLRVLRPRRLRRRHRPIDQDGPPRRGRGDRGSRAPCCSRTTAACCRSTPGKVAVIGPEADVIRNGGGSSAINSFRMTTPLQALRAKLGEGNVAYDDGSDAARAAAVAKSAPTAIVVVGDRMTEGKDKPCMRLNCDQPDRIDREALIEAVAAANPRTVVVLQSGGPVVTPWRGRVPAILEAWYPGDNGGTAIANVLFGDAEPGGRLPGTFPVAEADTPTAGDPEKYPGVGEVVKYKEGVLIGYRWYDEQDKDVAYPVRLRPHVHALRLSGLRMAGRRRHRPALGRRAQHRRAGGHRGAAALRRDARAERAAAAAVAAQGLPQGAPGARPVAAGGLHARPALVLPLGRLGLGGHAGLPPDRRRRALARAAAAGHRRPRRELPGRAEGRAARRSAGACRGATSRSTCPRRSARRASSSRASA